MHGHTASRAAEQLAAEGLPAHTLMRLAGQSVSRLALAVAPHARRIWVAAGPGNNGGDGLHAAIALQAAGKQVHVTLLADRTRLPDDARDALQAAQEAGVELGERPQPPADLDLAIDALLGLGSSRAPEGAMAEAIASLNRCRTPVVAVDLPSGLDAECGALFGTVAVKAHHTLSLLTLKPGLFTGEGRDHAGRVWWDDLGVPAPSPADAWLTGAALLDDLLPLRRHAQHKGSFGDVIVIGGSAGMSGAAWLAARAALAAGAGRVYVDVLDTAGTVPAQALELMCRPGLAGQGELLAKATVVCGCGGAQKIGRVLPTVLEHSGRLVLDADGLNAVAADAVLQEKLILRSSRGQPTLLTPHPLEAARLLGVDVIRVQSDRRSAAGQLAQRLRCAVLLKGSGTVCAAPDQAAYLNPTGNALLATAGTGDVLAGWAGGLWVQLAMPAGNLLHQAQQVGAAAAWWHGAAADAAASAGRRTPLMASALIDAMARLPLT